MQLHTLNRKTKRKKPKLVGRGGKRGTTAGRGTKGQRARAGHRIRPEIRDMIKKLPKRRGRGKNIFNTVTTPPEIVNLDIIDKFFSAGELVTPATLVEKGLVERQSGKIPQVKILGTGNVTRALTIERCTISASAREKIIAQKGTVKDRVLAVNKKK